MTIADRIIAFNRRLSLDVPLPPGVDVMNPYREKEARALSEQFYRKYYGDQNTRVLILGINPGRFGGGITGVPFTDPIKLEQVCGIPNALQKKAELSADFIYRMIAAYGGADAFYSSFYIGAVCPLGFTLNGKNLNYYDQKELAGTAMPFIVSKLEEQAELGMERSVCFCLGEGANYAVLRKLNDTHRFFNSVLPLPHPRFIMQYKRRRVDEYVQRYVSAFRDHLPDSF